MKIIRLGRWGTSSQRFFNYERIYWRFYGVLSLFPFVYAEKLYWTPFCKVTFRRDNLKAYLMELLFEKELESCANVIGIQAQDGIWDYNPYMHGMLNGMLLIEHIFTRRFRKGDSPDYVDAPKEWLRGEENLCGM